MYPSLVLKNQFGEESNNVILGGSSQISAKFTVASADAAGKGITGLTSQGIDAIYMHTSQTPDAGNPNPIAGYILAKFSKGFSSFQALATTVIPPQSGSSLLVASAGLSVGTVYVITTLGTTSAAQWAVLGVPVGVTPALGVAFVAIATSCTGTGAVEVPITGGAAIVSIQPIGNPSLGSLADGSKAWVTLACYTAGGTVAAPVLTMASYTPQGTNDSSSPPIFTGTAHVLTGTNSAPAFTGTNALGAPVDGTVIELKFSVIPLPAPLI